MMDNISSPKKAKNAHEDAIKDANKYLYEAGLKIEMNAGNVSLVPVEAGKK